MALGHLGSKQCEQTVDCKNVSFFLELDVPVTVGLIYLLVKEQGEQLINKKVLITTFIKTETKYKLHNRYGQK